jgi:hypothetical protein
MAEQREPERWLAVLAAVATACDRQNARPVPTSVVTRTLGTEGSRAVRAALRMLRRHGYVRSPPAPDDAPATWEMTTRGRVALRLRAHVLDDRPAEP